MPFVFGGVVFVCDDSDFKLSLAILPYVKSTRSLYRAFQCFIRRHNQFKSHCLTMESLRFSQWLISQK